MNSNVRDSLVEGFEHLIDSVVLPDKDDRHVVAAAIHSGASVIVTYNLKDFPKAVLAKYNIEAIHPDDFIADLIDLNIMKVLEAMSKHRGSLKNPPFEAGGYLEMLQKQALTQTVLAVKGYSRAI